MRRMQAEASSSLQVLLVDDSDITHALVTSLVEGSGVAVDSAFNGEEAVAMLRNRAGRYQLILMDLQMPVMDGYAATRLIREELALTIPVIALTASQQACEEQHCREAGMDGFLAKPLEGEKLLALFDGCGQPGNTGSAVLAGADAKMGGLRLDNLEMLYRAAPDRLSGTLRSVISASRADFDQARRLWRAGDAGSAARLAHKFRGSLGTFVQADFVEQMLALERAIQAGEPGLESRFAELGGRLDVLLEQLQSWLEGQPQP